jgi:hypothetical protein
MNITIESIEKYYNENKDEILSMQKHLNNFQTEQMQQEKIIVRNHNVNTFKIIHFLSEEVEQIKTKKLFAITRNEFYNPEVVDILLLFSGSIIYGSPHESRYFRKIRHWIRELTKLQSGAYGKVYSATVKGARKRVKIFLLKFGEKGDEEVTYHEYFIGSMLINNLRRKIPNFPITLGFVTCSPPIKALNFCRDFERRPCILYEYIFPSISSRKFFKGCSLEDFLNIFVQVLFAIRMASEEFEFNHKDLHTQNVLVKNIEKYISIPYRTPYGKMYLNTNLVAIIIDYGLSRVKMNGYPFSTFYRTVHDVDLNYPLADLFTFLADSLIVFNYYGNTLCFNESTKLLKFFVAIDDDKKMTEIVNRIQEANFTLPYKKEFKGLDGLNLFIEWLKKLKILDKVNLTEIPKFQSTECHEGCMSFEEILNEVKTTKTRQDIFYYYDILNSFPNKIEVPLEVIDIAVKNYENQVENIKKEVKNLKYSPDNIKDFYNVLMIIYFELQDILELEKTIKFISDYMRKNVYLSDISDVIKDVNERINRLRKIKLEAIYEENTSRLKALRSLAIPAPFV